jgi:L-malate glycosyltransferase
MTPPSAARGAGDAPPRVLMLCPNFGPERPLVGGAERQAEKLALALVARGCRVEVVTARDDPAWPAREVVNGLTIHRFAITDLSRVIPRGAGVPNLLLRQAQTRRAVRRLLRGFDLLHCHMASPFTSFACDAAASTGTPVLCKVACGGRLFDLLTTSEVTAGARRLSRNMVRRVDRWAAISDEIRRELVEWGVEESRITRIPNGVEPVDAPPLESGGVARRFLYLGRIAPNRDQPLLVRAFERLLERVPDAELAVVGSGELEGDLRRLVAEMPLGRARIRMEGYGDPVRWLRWAHAVVQPSRWEGMSNTLLEAMSAGRACAATDIPPNREVLGGGRLGLLSAPGDVEGMAASLLRLALEPGEAARLGALGRAEVERVYGIGGVADRYLELYRGMLSGRA